MIDCPDCEQPWNVDVEPVCPSCGLSTEALDDAAAFLAQLDAERHDERKTIEL